MPKFVYMNVPMAHPELGCFLAGHIYMIKDDKLIAEITKQHPETGVIPAREATQAEVRLHQKKKRLIPPEFDSEQKKPSDIDAAFDDEDDEIPSKTVPKAGTK